MTYAPTDTKGPFLDKSPILSQDKEQFLIKLTSLHTDIANAVNSREISIYEEKVQVNTGNQFSIPFVAGQPLRKKNSYRKTFYFGAIAPGAALSIAHGIANLVECTKIGATCITNKPDFRPIPYSSATLVTDQIQILVDAANIVITNGATAPAIVSGKAIIEYFLN